VIRSDHTGVPTPMQWSRAHNAGFSSAEPGRLYLPVITDPVYGYEAVNVAAQMRQPSSLLNTMRRLLAARRSSPVFGRGAIEFLRPRNSRVLAYLRRLERETLLIVANLSAAPQPVELDLTTFAGVTPVEMLGGTVFPTIRPAPYFLSLGPHGFYWFRLEHPGDGDRPYGIETTAI
jgi:maltose alpha-D-glucosyltransferase / alpha-amylase